MSIGDAADKPRDCRARPLPLNRLQLQSTRSVTSGMPPALRIPIAHRLFGGALGLALAVALAGCGGQAGCDSEAVIEKAIAAVRANYPNDVSKELLKRGSVAALDRILREKKLDYKDEKQLEVGARPLSGSPSDCPMMAPASSTRCTKTDRRSPVVSVGTQ